MVAAALGSIVTKHAFVSPAANGWVTVLDAASQAADSDERLRRVGAALAASLRGAVLAIRLEDDDLFVLIAFRHGTLTLDERVMSKGDRGRPASDATRRSAAASELANTAG